MSEQTPTSYRLENLTKVFPGVLAVDNVSLEVRNGEIHGIIGKNGAGKSVTVSMIAGIIRPTSGALWIGNQPVAVEQYTPGRAHELGVSLIPQEPLFSPDLSVTDNLFMGIPRKRQWGFVDHTQMRDLAHEIARRLTVQADPRQKMKELPLEDQQLLAFGKALFLEKARVILLDEITASLPHHRKKLLLQFLRGAVRESNDLSFTLISHHINEIIEFCDRVTVMRDGRAIQTLNVAETTHEELAALVVGDRQPQANNHNGNGTRHKGTSATQTGAGDATLLQVRGLRKQGAFTDVSFELAKGEVLGLAGLDGSGKNEVLEALAGITPVETGTIAVNGTPVSINSPRDAQRCRIAYLPKKREEQAVIHNRPVQDNILLPIFSKLRTAIGLIDRQRGRGIASQKVAELNIKTPSLDTKIDHLSGGNRQKVVLSRVALTEPLILVLNEPTRGVDLATKPDILKMIRTRLTQNSGVIFTSESEEELVETCDRILIFYRGQIQQVFLRNTEDFTVSKVYRAIQGIELSEAG